MPTIKRINHVAIIVADIDASLCFWRDALGLRVSHVEEVPDQDAVVAFLPTGQAEIELVMPTSDESGVARFLDKRGPGMHHICFEVDDLEERLQRLKQAGIRLINPEPVVGTGGKRIAFIHPESTEGVLVELYQLTEQEPAIRNRRAQELAGQTLAQGQALAAGVRGFLRALRREDCSDTAPNGD
jgi:methylmalonyl-CoA/ethylmalonyl-CoA epimerase